MLSRSFAALLVTLACTTIARADHHPSPDRRERARTFLVVHLASALKLTDAAALRAGTVIQRADERRLQLQQQALVVERKIGEALKRRAPEADLAALIAEGSDLNRQISLLPDDTFRELQRDLTVEQQAQLLLLQRELQQQLRRDVTERLGKARQPHQVSTPR
jgi:hypothetical protein